MAKFLSRAEIYRILQRELPEGIYPDGAPAAYVSTAENDAVAQATASLYSSMSDAYLNLILITATEAKISDWETTIFGRSPTEDLTLTERVDRCLAKIRSQEDISLWQIVQTVAGIVGEDRFFEVRQRNTRDDIISGQIKGERADEVWAPGWVSGDPAPAGVTVTDSLRTNQSEMLSVRVHTYTYDVVVFSDTDFTTLQAELDSLLTETEPARSDHSITVIPTVDDFVSDDGATRINYTGYDGYLLKRDNTTDFGLRRYSWYFGFEDDPSAIGFADDDVAPTVGGHWWFSLE